MNSLRQRARYRIDNALSRGVSIVLVWVALSLLSLVLLVSLVMWLWQFGPQDQPTAYVENLWQSLTRSLDPGTFGADEGVRFRLAGLVVTLGGLVAVSLVIGLLSNAVDSRLEHLRRGRSLVLESGHVLILGSSAKLPIVIRELMQAYASTSRKSIVVLADEDKVELEESLRRQLPRESRTRLVVRRGEPASLHDLAQVRPELAGSVIILRPDSLSADAEVVRVAMAVAQARSHLDAIPVVAELDDRAVARSLRQALAGRVITVVSPEVIARIAAQTSRAAGLGTIYQELLDFEGDELYTIATPSDLIGHSFFDAVMAADGCLVVGLIDSEESALLCPSMDTVLTNEHKLITIASEASASRFKNSARSPSIPRHEGRPPASPSKANTLVIGWNRFAARILEEMDAHSEAGSMLSVLVDDRVEEGFSEQALAGLKHHEVIVARGDTTDRQTLNSVLTQAPFAHIIVLCAHSQLTPLESDARSLLTLMHIRNFLDTQENHWNIETNLVSEVLDPDSVDIAHVARPDDFIVSQRLVSLFIAQITENPHRKKIIEQLLSSDGVQVAIVKCSEYLEIGEHNFDELRRSAARLGEIAIGWRDSAKTPADGQIQGDIQINPRANERLVVTRSTRAIVLTNR